MKALDTSWRTLAECFESHELLMKQDLVDRYFPDLEDEGAGEAA